MTLAQPATETVAFVDSYCAAHCDLFSDVRVRSGGIWGENSDLAKGFFRPFDDLPLSCRKQPHPQQIQLAVPVHLPIHLFQPIHTAFDPTVRSFDHITVSANHTASRFCRMPFATLCSAMISRWLASASQSSSTAWRSRTIVVKLGQEIDDLFAFTIYQDRAVALTFAWRSIINAEHAWRW